ncbi:hypothetical protein DSECCO2_451960 [anaerobic digester metagenome]
MPFATPIPAVPVAPADLGPLCRRWRVRTLLLFGSALRDDFSDASDLDLVVDFLPGAEPTLWELAALASELEVLTGRRVDLHTLRGVEQDRNRLRRSRILETMVPIYAA